MLCSPTPTRFHVLLGMFELCPGLLFQPFITAVALVYPEAMFSPEADVPHLLARVHGLLTELSGALCEKNECTAM